MNRQQYGRDFLTLHRAYEVAGYKLFKRALDKQVKAVINHVEENGAGLLSNILPILLPEEPIKQAYLSAYEFIGTRHGRFVARWYKQQVGKGYTPNTEQKAISFSSEYWKQLMQQYYLISGAKKVVEVNLTTIANIQKILESANAAGLSMLQTAELLVTTLSDPNYNQARGMLIARTESTAAAGYITQTAGEQADFQTEKIWISAVDARTRDSHRIMNDRPGIPVDEFFEVPGPAGGVEYALHPGGDGLSAANSCNCRCALALQPKLDEDGLPISRTNSLGELAPSQ